MMIFFAAGFLISYAVIRDLPLLTTAPHTILNQLLTDWLTQLDHNWTWTQSTSYLSYDACWKFLSVYQAAPFHTS